MTVTLKLAELPLAAVILTGWVVMLGGKSKVNDTMLLVTLPEGLVMTTS